MYMNYYNAPKWSIIVNFINLIPKLVVLAFFYLWFDLFWMINLIKLLQELREGVRERFAGLLENEQ